MKCDKSFTYFFRAIILEVIFGAFPGAIFQTYMVFVLQQDELDNFVSIISSMKEVIMGFASVVIFEKFGVNVPGSKLIWASLAGFIDVAFRILFISFFSSIFEPYYALLIIPMYIILKFYMMWKENI